MQAFLKHPQWKAVKSVCDLLTKNGHQAVLAGGCVRDALLGIKAKDFDVATDAKPERIEELFPSSIGVGRQFGVMILPMGKFNIEIASFRKDSSYSDGRHPDAIIYGTLEEDSLRRDFTVNAMFFDPKSKKLIDLVEGQKDLKKHILRSVGEASVRFAEDHLRILRCVRFAAQLDFDIDEKTWKSVCELRNQVTTVSRERIRDEMAKLFISKNKIKGLGLLDQSRLVEILFPEAVANWSDLKFTLSFAPKIMDSDLGFAALAWIVDEPLRKDFLKSLKLSNNSTRAILFAIEYWNQLHRDLPTSKLLTLLSHEGSGLLCDFHLMQLKSRGKKTFSAKEFTSILKKADRLPVAFLSGEDLEKANIAKGPTYKVILGKAYELQLDGKIKNRKQALTWLKKSF